MFLIEKLPSDDKHLTSATAPVQNKNALLQEISKKIAEDLNTMWTPPSCILKSHMIGDFILSQGKKMQSIHYYHAVNGLDILYVVYCL